ncbi:MAG: hypothetical protein P4L87_22865 [Formivibrio sp.]|nr:hypothetical protein [Formivibrio sp.]
MLVAGCLIYAASALWVLLVTGTDRVSDAMATGRAVWWYGRHGLAIAVGSAINQAMRQIGSVMGVALTVLLGSAGFDVVYLCHMGLALLTAALCLSVKTRPAAVAKKS